MKIWHRIALRADQNIMSKLDAIGVQYKTTPYPIAVAPLISFDVVESDPLWPAIVQLIGSMPEPPSDICGTTFSEEELSAAEWVRLVPTFQQGYPQPEEAWQLDHPNYADYCPQCGTYRQVANFRIKKEPRLGRNDFFSMHWIYALFSTPRVIAELDALRLTGYEIWDAIIHKTDTPSQTVSQVFVPSTADAGLLGTDDMAKEPCSVCSVIKYSPHRRGVMHIRRNSLPTDKDLVLSQEWFGSRHMAYREILASARVARTILDQDWRGVTMKVVELV
jgi:hypothetical protein